MIRFNLVVEANADEVRNVATVEMSDRQWDAVLCFVEDISLELGELEDMPVRSVVRRVARVLWRMLDYAADSFPPAPGGRMPDGQVPAQEFALDTGERLASLVAYLSEYEMATLVIERESPVRR